MQLVDKMRQRLEGEDSPFRAQLIKEDIARLTKLQAMALEHDDLESFCKAGLYIGWTRDDFRTHDLKDQLDVLLGSIYARQREGATPSSEKAVIDAWVSFNTARMEKLVHCL